MDSRESARFAKVDDASSFIAEERFAMFLASQKVVMEAIVTTKGRFTIPAELRRKYGIKPATRIAFKQVGNAVELRPITPAYIDSIRGILQNKPGEKPMTQQLIKAHAAEVVRDEAGVAE